jgi:hypothetical protein
MAGTPRGVPAIGVSAPLPLRDRRRHGARLSGRLGGTPIAARTPHRKVVKHRLGDKSLNRPVTGVF